MKTIASILTMYAVTPCHAGSGSSTGVVDLPIQRERHTNWPMIQASGLKGAMRSHFDRFKNAIKEKTNQELTEKIFGTSETGDSGHAGSLCVGDVRILAFPMRSNVAPFVWITCPAVLKRVNRDLAMAGKELLDLAVLSSVTEKNALWCGGAFREGDRVLLEDMEVSAAGSAELDTELLQSAERLLIVHDEIFDYGVSHCTQVMAQIAIDQKSGTSKEGLRYQEELPADTLMYSVIFWGDSRDKEASVKQDVIRRYITEEVMPAHLQVGGDETLGRGIFSLNWIA